MQIKYYITFLLKIENFFTLYKFKLEKFCELGKIGGIRVKKNGKIRKMERFHEKIDKNQL